MTTPSISSPCIEGAVKYCRRGWWVTPTQGKVPVLDDWTNRRLGEEDIIAIFRPEDNVGVILGASGLADIDFDDAAAVKACEALAPPELADAAIFEHAGRPHLIARSDRVKTRRFRRPDGTTLLEVRGDGAQSVFPPSTHPDGKPYQWVSECDPAEVEPGRLEVLARMLATVAYASEFWSDGSRHDLALALAGFLARRLTEPDVAAVLRAVATVAADAEMGDRERTVLTTVRRIKNGEPIVGLPTLERLAPELARTLASWWPIVSEARTPGSVGSHRVSQADLLVEIGKITELFHDSTGTPFARWQ